MPLLESYARLAAAVREYLTLDNYSESSVEFRVMADLVKDLPVDPPLDGLRSRPIPQRCSPFRTAEDYRDHLPCDGCEPSKPDPEAETHRLSRYAHEGYNAYGEHTDWRNYQGLPMPTWESLPQGIRDAWIAATRKILEQ